MDVTSPTELTMPANSAVDLAAVERYMEIASNVPAGTFCTIYIVHTVMPNDQGSGVSSWS